MPQEGCFVAFRDCGMFWVSSHIFDNNDFSFMLVEYTITEYSISRVFIFSFYPHNDGNIYGIMLERPVLTY